MPEQTYTLINTNPMGAVDLYILGEAPIHLELGDEFDVSEEVAIDLLNQATNYALKDGQTDPRPPEPVEEEPAVDPTPVMPAVGPAPVVAATPPVDPTDSKTVTDAPAAGPSAAPSA